ncbi:MAG: hypothetical protein JKY19_08990 [Alcanivoracaceae bacterium]|nr:hypothetical protein [Alcanivoracaceae bacterium]
MYVTEEGLVIPTSMINGKRLTLGTLSPEQGAEFKRLEQQKRQKHQGEMEAKEKIRQEEARLKKINPNQIDLF